MWKSKPPAKAGGFEHKSAGILVLILVAALILAVVLVLILVLVVVLILILVIHFYFLQLVFAVVRYLSLPGLSGFILNFEKNASSQPRNDGSGNPCSRGL